MSADRIDHEAVRQLALILTETGLTEIEVEGKEGRIRVVRPPPQVVQATVAAVPAAAAPEAPPGPPDESRHPGAVLSPMVGIAYLSPEPSAPMFVTVGTVVATGQTLLLIEAMKTFNQIKAPKAGTVTRILVPSGT
ncbi:MAG: acetyl-CoA carboxylase, biotin carboxyl carrier protein, partial [Devosia sp.]|nr:acetyl-CoA carboxylase, biotin carboxyl carrier protein [Devosia sp.]